MPSLRERKRDRTRAALLDAAAGLFERHGYDATTVADIAAAAEIGTRTFFSYFASKEELLFPDAAARVRTALDTIADRAPDDRPVDVLLRALDRAGNPTEADPTEADPTENPDDLVSRLAALRLRLVDTVPAVRARALTLQADAQQEIAGQLRLAYPDELDAVAAAALVGAFLGAVTGALRVLLADPAAHGGEPDLRRRLATAVEGALRPYR